MTTPRCHVCRDELERTDIGTWRHKRGPNGELLGHKPLRPAAKRRPDVTAKYERKTVHDFGTDRHA